MADPNSPTHHHLSSIDDVPSTSSNPQQEQQHEQQHDSTNHDWPWPTDDQHQQESNPIDSSGLMHLITTGGTANVNTNPSDESLVTMTTNGQSHEHLGSTTDETHPDDHQQLPLAPSSSAVTGTSLPMETEQQTVSTDAPTQPSTKSQHNIAEIHREMLVLIPIPEAWPHIRHQSGLFSYPDLPHFNVIRQATFREGRFVCPFCTVDFASKEGIRYHLYNSCTKSPYPKAFFRCLMCGSELADRSSLRTHLARHGADENGMVSVDKIDVSRKPAISTPETPNSKKKKKKKGANDVTPPQMINPMLAMTSSVSPRGLDPYNIPPTMINSQMSLPIIKSDLNDSDPKRKRGRPPKTKSDGPTTPIAPYTKQIPMNLSISSQMNPMLTAPVILDDQHLKNDPNKNLSARSPRGIDISSELAELARSRMREHIEFATDSLLPEQEQEINARLRTEGSIQCHRCRGKNFYNSIKKLKEHFKTDCPLGPVSAVCKFCRTPFTSVSDVSDHLELYHDDSHDTCPEDPWRINDRAFRLAFARYKFPSNNRICFSAPATTIGQLIPGNESAACLSNGANCLRVRMLSCDRFLNPLDSFAASYVIVLNVGRPIRCIEWLPRPVDVIGSQYVALALEQWSYDGTNSMHNNYPADRRSPPGSTLLLILNCGRLRQSLHVPNLHVTVAADFGQVTCLKWLPERPGMNDPYLSYLAIGTSQGIVIIFGVPPGASRNLCTINSGAQLVPPLNRRKDGSIGCAEYGSCTALDWCHDNPNKLCAGYENGIVLMWELNSKSLVEQAQHCSLIYPVRRFFVEDTPVQDVKFLRNSEHLIAISLKNKQSWTVWTTRDENIFCYRHWSSASEFSASVLHNTLYAGCAHANNQNELVSVPTQSILLPGQNVSNHLQGSMLSAWQIVSVDYSEWIDSVTYADLDGTVWVARGDSSTWAQTNPKFRPSACVAKLSTYLTNTTSGNLNDHAGMQQYNQNQGGPAGQAGQYCVQIAIERTEFASSNVDPQHDETHKVHTYRKIRFNPNPGTHGWIASGDKVGLFLLFRLSTSDSALSEKLTQRLQRVQAL